MYKTARNLSVLGVGLSASAIVGWLLLRETKRLRTPSGVSAKQQGELSSWSCQKLYCRLIHFRQLTKHLIADDDLTQINGIGPRYAECFTCAPELFP